METIDQAAEWRRLTELYREMSDDELQVLSEEAYDLTEMARDVLSREIASRGLKMELGTKPPESEEPEGPMGDLDPSELDLMPITRVWDYAEASRLKQIYEDAGIPLYLGPKNVERVEDFDGRFEKGVELKVRSVDQQRSILALRYADETSPLPKEPEPERSESMAVRCPKCRSEEVVFDSLEKESPDQPDFQAKFNWSCDACGHTWQDDGVEK